MNKKAQAQIIGPFIAIMVFLLFSSILLPLLSQSFNEISCTNEKNTISDLTSQLQNCNSQLTTEQQKTQGALNDLGICQNQLSSCQQRLTNCTTNYNRLQEECAKKERPLQIYYFVKVYSNKIILFDVIILHVIHIFALFLSLGMSMTMSLFEIDVEIKVLNKKNQKKLVRVIREYLIKNPWAPVFIVILGILLTNIFWLIFK